MWEKKLKNKVREYLKGYTACHDCYHLQRVENYALEIAEKIDCDKDILKASALLHDIGYRYHEKDDKNHHLHGMKIAERWLKEINFPQEKIPDVVEAIRLHDNLHWDINGEKTSHIETMIIQDADRIEALGAIGITRLIYYFGERGYPIYNPAKIKKTKKIWFDHSLPDQIRRDTLKKWENLNFDYSKKISQKRNEFLKRFYQELKMELSLHHKIQKEMK
jgi:uncharacterized protein